ncbi:DUF4394 domain-containing protein [Spirillospora sp. NPDC050679]
MSARTGLAALRTVQAIREAHGNEPGTPTPDGRLYGVGDRGGVRTPDVRPGGKDAGKGVPVRKMSQLAIALSERAFVVDVNPVANRLRVISDTGRRAWRVRNRRPGAVVSSSASPACRTAHRAADS